MNNSSPKTKHHFVPVFYLKGFVNSNGSLWVYDKNDKGLFESSPEGIAYEKHYFSFTNLQGEKDSETVENAMSELEGKFAGVVKKILNCKELSEKDNLDFALFVSSMMVRVPNMKENIRESTGEVIKRTSLFIASNKENFEKMIENYEKNTGKKISMTPEELRQWMLNENNYTVNVDHQYAIGMALSLLDSFARIFFNMKWRFIKATNDYKFMTGDNPLRYFDPTHNPHSFYGVGLANKNIEVTIPLSKDMAAFGSWERSEGYFQGSNQHVKHINRMTVIASRRFVFAHNKSEIIDKFVKKYKGSHLVIKVG
ncbi:MAG: DUF4238 domain-containing protein [Candidatus Omnitrophica bacterium]|nr:DUF4238 domain-containing protein [Candidatus Omnitrophota bacterium]